MAVISKKKELIFSTGMTVLTIGLLVRAFLYPRDSSQFPRFLMILQLFFSLLLLVRAIRIPATPRASKPKIEGLKSIAVPFQIFASASLYLLMISFLGYFTATAIFLCGTMAWFGTRKLLVIFAVTAGFILVIYALFVLFIGVRLPTGILI